MQWGRGACSGCPFSDKPMLSCPFSGVLVVAIAFVTSRCTVEHRIVQYSTVHSTRYTVHSTQYTVHITHYTVYSTHYTIHSTQHTILYSIQYSTIRYSIQYNILYSPVQSNTIQHNAVQYSIVQYNSIQHNTIQYNTESTIYVVYDHISYRHDHKRPGRGWAWRGLASSRTI